MHDVSPAEIDEFFTESLFLEHNRKDGSFEAIAKLRSSRYLQVIYRKKSKNLFFIITAFDILDKDYISIVDDYTS